MTKANRDFIEANLHHFLTLERAGYLRGLNANEREGMQRVISEEFQKGYTSDLWCGTCVSDMVWKLYRHYHEWLRKETGCNTLFADLTEGIQEMIKLLK